jgi:hypothetical protein
MTDREFAARFGMSMPAVYLRRKALGIPAFVAREPIVITPELIEALYLPDSAACQRTGYSSATIQRLRRKLGISSRKRPWTPEVIARLGKEPDQDIARDLGFALRSVQAKRQMLGIPPCPNSLFWRPEEVALLGTMPDEEVAARLGRPILGVQAKRKSLKIPSPRGPKR